MSDIQRIRSLMMISEQEQKPVTTPLNVKGLVLLLQHVHKIEPEWIESVESYEDVNFAESLYFGNKLGKEIEKHARLFGLPTKISADEFDFISAFILENKNKIIEGIKDYSEYIIPKQKTFIITGEERYTARKGDIFELKETAYNEEYLKELINSHEIMVSDGKFIREEWGDTWDMEQEILEIKEVTPENVNEQVDLDNFQAPFTSEDFVNYVNSEFDIEMLKMMQNVIQKRMNFLKRMVDMGKRKEIKGFRRFD